MRVDAIANILKEKGNYRRVPPPLHIADVEFAFPFDAFLTGPDDQRGLVLILDQGETTLGLIARKIRALSVALDRTGSNRPISVILISDENETAALAELSEYCRLIVVPTNQDPAPLLRSLLPLTLPAAGVSRKSAEQALRERVEEQEGALMDELISGARANSGEVEKIVLKWINKALNEATNGPVVP